MDIFADYTVKELLQSDVWPLGTLPLGAKNRLTLRKRDIEQIDIDIGGVHVYHLLLEDGTTVTFSDQIMSSNQVIVPPVTCKQHGIEQGDRVVAFIDPER